MLVRTKPGLSSVLQQMYLEMVRQLHELWAVQAELLLLLLQCMLRLMDRDMSNSWEAEPAAK